MLGRMWKRLLGLVWDMLGAVQEVVYVDAMFLEANNHIRSH